MGTRSLIAVMTDDQNAKSVYCHYDGYLEHIGMILHEHYETLEGALSLVNSDLKYFSGINREGTPYCIYTYDGEPERYYHNGSYGQILDNIVITANNMGCEFAYFYIHNQGMGEGDWLVAQTAHWNRLDWRPLGEALKGVASALI